MQRVCVIGSSGSGKSTLAARVGERLGLPVRHMDTYYWRAGWTPPTPEEWEGELPRLVEGERWIIDGNYSATLAIRLARADTVVFLDYPRTYCVRMALRRYWNHRGSTRPCMTEGCPEKIDLEFLGWIWGYQKRSRPKVLRLLGEWLGAEPAQLAQLSEHRSTASGSLRRYLRFTSRRDSEGWLQGLSSL